MRLRNIPGAKERIEESDLVIHAPETVKNINDSFPEKNPLRIEVGMGKGRFIIENAIKNPDINYVGIEMYSSVLYRALQKMEEMGEERPRNLKFICMDARDIDKVFNEKEVDRIYLNFSDPWPKDRHAKRRLTSRQFLSKFKKILKDDGVIEFKTDNKDLFMFSLDEIVPGGFRLLEKTFDLHNDDAMNVGNIMTEYEERFSSIGNPIYKYVIAKDTGSDFIDKTS